MKTSFLSPNCSPADTVACGRNGRRACCKNARFGRAAPTALWLAFFLGVAPGSAHELTRRSFEQSLDPRETVALAKASSLQGIAAGGRVQRECRLSLKLIDAGTQQTVPGLVRIVAASGRALELPGLVNRGLKLRAGHPGKEWYVLPEPSVILVPREQVRIEVFSGLETELAVATVDLRAESERELSVPLQRFFSACRLGWHSGNTHLQTPPGSDPPENPVS